MVHASETTLIGSVGVALLLLAFVLNTLRIVRASDLVYMGLNLVGAGLACYASYLLAFIPFVVLEGVWALVAGAAMLRALLSRADSRSP